MSIHDLAEVFDILARAADGSDADRRVAVPVARDRLAAAMKKAA